MSVWLKKNKTKDKDKIYPSDRYAYKTNAKDPIYIPVNRIRTIYQTDKALDEKKVKSNLSNIRKGKPMEPIVIGYGSDDGRKADLHDGHHRLEAAKRAGHTHVPCVVGGRNEKRVKAAEKRYRRVWKSMLDEKLLQEEQKAAKLLNRIKQIISIAEEHENDEISGTKKPTTDKQQMLLDRSAVNILDQIKIVFEDAKNDEEKEIKAKKHFVNDDGKLLIKRER